jgi:hypothetical protein
MKIIEALKAGDPHKVRAAVSDSLLHWKDQLERPRSED